MSRWINRVPSGSHKCGMCLRGKIKSPKQLKNQGKEQLSEMAFRHPGLPRLMGNPQEFLTSPYIRPSSNAGNLVHYLQQTQWNHFLNETPLQPQALSQRLSFGALPQIPHSSHFLPFPQSGMKSSNLISSMQFPRHPSV